MKKEILKCNICGNVAFKLHNGPGKMACCNKEMQVLQPNSVDAAQEKHVPVVQECELSKIDPKMKKIIIGSVAHPMEEKHYIEWVATFTNKKASFHWLKPGDAPEVMARVEDNCEIQEYCNLHGLWKK